MKQIALFAYEIDILKNAQPGIPVLLLRPMNPQPRYKPFQVQGDASGNWYNENREYPRRGEMMRKVWRPAFCEGETVTVSAASVLAKIELDGAKVLTMDLPEDGRFLLRVESVGVIRLNEEISEEVAAHKEEWERHFVTAWPDSWAWAVRAQRMEVQR